ncbi:4-aminobutyrate aminotransferase [Clostridiales bacterium PH28_bin88]|nr:4-aminobutyrate aminotransferase [Clostridiales bacterium PH28_bin88]
MSTLFERAQKVLPPAAGRATRLGVVKAEGSYLYGEDGKKYLDFASGVAVCNTGHTHPRVVAAARAQMESMVHAGHNVVYYESYVKLAEKLVELTGGDTMVYFSNSGAEANEGAIKLAKYVSGRPAVIAFKGGFHGRTLGSVSLTTSNAAYRKHYEGLLPSVYFAEYPYCYRCPFGRVDATCAMECLEQFNRIFKLQVDPESVAAIIVEPVQGEGGYVVPPVGFMQGLRRICDDHGIALIFDEIQTGFGRTGKMFAAEHFGIRADITSLAKGIASGFPLSAVVGRADLMRAWPAGAHGGTYGGNPVACAAALATIELLEEGLVENAAAMGAYLQAGLRELQARYPVIGDVRGLGLMTGVELVGPDREPDGALVNRVLAGCLEEGLILLGCGAYKNVIRLIAPTTVTRDEIDQALKVLAGALTRGL